MAKTHLFLPLVVYHIFFITIINQLKLTHSLNSYDLSALRQIKNTLTDISTTSTFFSTWDFSAPDPCSSFAGVTCYSDRVTVLSLGTGFSDSPGLAGTLSPAIGRLTELNQLILYSGIITGQIPTEIAYLRRLKVISLTNNRLTGVIPGAIFRLPELHTLDLSHNQLAGRIPAAITAFNLKVLILAGNELSGHLPRSLPAGILHLDLAGNFFSGGLPTKIPTTLRYISLSRNRLWGKINGLDSISELTYLDLSMNRFSGSIPVYLLRPAINSLLLQRNNFSGWVPQQSSTWRPSVGSTVDFSHNFLTGQLNPSLIGVQTLFLNNNRLVGPVPEEYVQSVKSGTMKTLYLQHNYLTVFPIEEGSVLPDTAMVCLSYNCMAAPPFGMAACPISAGDQVSRPGYQCDKVHKGGSD